MEDNRIIIMDELLRDSLMLDYNNIYDYDDFKTYKKSLYWAIEHKDISNIEDGTRFVKISKIESPFALVKAINPEWYFTSEGYLSDTSGCCTGCSCASVELDLGEIVDRYITKDTSISGDNPYTRVLSIITNYLHGNTIMPGYFSGILGEISTIQEYELIPVIMYIIKEQINNLTRLGKII